jgi:uncharacterized caspase-like protein
MCATIGKKYNEENISGKYALVIGNANYKSIIKLENPQNDAEDVSNALKQLGFKVELGIDLNFAQMERAINKFIEKISTKNITEGLFYFAGQGFSINGINYLVPVDLQANNATQIISQSYAMKTLFNKLMTTNNIVNVVIIDTCFTKMTLPSPFPHRGIIFFPTTDQDNLPIENDGLELLEEFTKDIFYLQSTLPGQIAFDGIGRRNSPFTMALLKNLMIPKIFIELVKDIMTDTMEYSNGQQHPYFKGNIFNHEDYIINR